MLPLGVTESMLVCDCQWHVCSLVWCDNVSEVCERFVRLGCWARGLVFEPGLWYTSAWIPMLLDFLVLQKIAVSIIRVCVSLKDLWFWQTSYMFSGRKLVLFLGHIAKCSWCRTNIQEGQRESLGLFSIRTLKGWEVRESSLLWGALAFL